MTIDIWAAVIAGLAGTAIMTGMMLFGRQLNLPAVDAHGILGHVNHPQQASPLGYIAHFLLGALFAIGYAFVFEVTSFNIYLLGAVLGTIHWLAVGWMFGLAPIMHAGMKSGLIEETGPYMLKSLGVAGFIAGLIGHIVFGLVVAVVYSALAGMLGI